MKEALFHPHGERWDWIHCEKVHNLMGMRRVMAPITRLQALGEAVQGELHEDRPGGRGRPR